MSAAYFEVCSPNGLVIIVCAGNWIMDITTCSKLIGYEESCD